MKKPAVAVLFILFFLVLSPLNAQVATPHYVVVDQAESEISQLEGRNLEMTRANDQLEQENEILYGEIAASEEFIVLADDMIDRLSASAGEIYTAMQDVSDPETRRELQTKMEENRQSRYDLENRKRREYESIARAGDQIETNRKMIAVNRVRTKANTQRIEYLRACIDLSLNENRDVESVLDNADLVRRDVEQLLNR